MRMNKWTIRGLLAGSTILLVAQAYTYSEGPPPGVTGAPTDGATCSARGCHTGHPLNTTGGSVTIGGVPSAYVPGATYTITVQVAKPGQSRWGFEITAETADGGRAGELVVTDQQNTQYAQDPTVDNSPEYIEHTFNGTRGGQGTGPVWTMQWVAPAAGTGPVTFYAAGNAANGNGNQTGDYIYTTSVTSPEGSASPAVVYGDLNGDGKVNVQDATMALQIAVGLVQATDAQMAAGDVAPTPGIGPRAGQPFGDGKVNVSDATRILQRAVGIITDF